MSKVLTPKDPVTEEQALVALATFRTDEEALAYLKRQGVTTTEKQLSNKRRSKATEIEQVRKEIAPRLEEQLTGDILDEARYATAIIDKALRRTEERLEKNLIIDTAKAARDLAQLRQQGLEKRAMLEGKPTTIVEKRSPQEILAKLQAMGVIQRVDAEATSEDDDFSPAQIPSPTDNS